MSNSTKKKHQHSAKKSIPQSPKRKLVFWGLGLLALAVAVYYFMEQRGGYQSKNFMGESGSEPTLTAKNPRLQLLSAAETGVDFQNQVPEQMYLVRLLEVLPGQFLLEHLFLLFPDLLHC